MSKLFYNCKPNWVRSLDLEMYRWYIWHCSNAHSVSNLIDQVYSSYLSKIKAQLVPPNPKLLDMALLMPLPSLFSKIFIPSTSSTKSLIFAYSAKNSFSIMRSKTPETRGRCFTRGHSHRSQFFSIIFFQFFNGHSVFIQLQIYV